MVKSKKCCYEYGEKSTYEWFVSNPINNYNISVQIGNYVAVQDTFIKNDQGPSNESLCT